MFSKIISGTIYGLKGYLIEVEVDFSNGLPCMVMVGSLSGEVKESAERVRVALKNCDITIPPMHIAINLSPGDIKKSGTGFDLPISFGMLLAMGIIDEEDVKDTLILGELGLDGSVKKVEGVMPIVWEAKKNGISKCIVPEENLKEAMLVGGMKIMPAGNILSCIEKLKNGEYIESKISTTAMPGKSGFENRITCDFNEIVGQETLKRGALIAVSGFHHMLIVGPPGAGKTMLAKRIPSILPQMTMEEIMDVTSIYSVAGLLSNENPIVSESPFVSPHHTVTPQGIAGGGRIPKPGAVSLAHKGVLFLDELPEFNRSSIDLLRQPLEDKTINISRTSGNFVYPADFMLVGAMNPCPCGYYPNHNKCNCTPNMIRNYLGHISGPIMDRIDICLTAEKVSIHELGRQSEEEKGNSVSSNSLSSNSLSSNEMKNEVLRVREIQRERFKDDNIRYNSEMKINHIKKYCRLQDGDREVFEGMCNKIDLSARGYHRLLRVARTIADIEDSKDICMEHLMEAICYRPQLPEV